MEVHIVGQIVITQEADTPWRWSSKKAWSGTAEKGEPGVRYKVLNSATIAGPNVQLAQYEPGHVEPAHSHPHDEVLYILEGAGTVGDRDLTPGMLLYVEKDTLYGPLTSGPNGLTFLRVQTS